MATVYSTGFNAKPSNPMYSVGKKERTVHSRFAILTAAAANNDVYVLAGPLTYNERVAHIISWNATPALTSATDNDIGFYYKRTTDGVFVEIDKDILVDGGTLASALSARDVLFSLNPALDSTKTIGALLGKSVEQEPAGGVYLCLTTNIKPSVDGVLDLDIILEEGTNINK